MEGWVDRWEMERNVRKSEMGVKDNKGNKIK
jgi:hypothetical protein